MADGIGGWSVPATSGANLPAVALKPGKSGLQHVIRGISLSFSAAPAAPVLAQLINPDLSPNPVLWEGYVSVPRDVAFADGISCTIGSAVALVLGGGGGSLIGKATLHGHTR